MLRQLLAMALAALICAELARLLDMIQGFPWLTRVLLLIIFVVSAVTGRLGLREAYLTLASLLLSILVWLLMPANAIASLAKGVDQATYLLCFVIVLGLLYDAAATSPSVARIGYFLTRQKSGHRYASLFLGSGVLSVVFNVGVVNLLVPLVQKGVVDQIDPDVRRLSEKRQISAILRGFAWGVIWSPTAVAPLMLAQLIPGVDRVKWLMLGIAIYLFTLVIGMFEDGLRSNGGGERQNQDLGEPFPWICAGNLVLVCLLFFAVAIGIAFLSGRNFMSGLLLGCPLILIIWQSAQTLLPRHLASPQELGRRLLGTLVRLPDSAGVALTLAGAGFLGATAASLLTNSHLADYLTLQFLPDYMLLSLLPLLLVIASLLCLSPAMTSVFLGSVFAGLPALPADPTLIALSISCGWGLSQFLSPVSTPALVIDRISELSSREITFGWNLVFGILCWLMLWPLFAVLSVC